MDDGPNSSSVLHRMVRALRTCLRFNSPRGTPKSSALQKTKDVAADPRATSVDCSLRPEWLNPESFFPIPDWRQVGEWIELQPQIQHNELWCGVARNWAKEIARHFGGTCRAYESPHFFAVIPGELDRGKRAMVFYEQLYRQLRSTLGDMALKEWFGKFTLFIAPDQDTYYRYFSNYTAPGDHIQSGGVYINRGYGHIALPSPDSIFDTRVLAHELCHALLCHHDLPLWLNEGVTQATEIALAGQVIQDGHRKPLPDHRDFWDKDRIALFWSGRGFDTPGDTSSLCYDLSLRIVRAFLAIDRKGIAAVVINAKRQDSAFGAFRECFKQTPADFLNRFLGFGDWTAGHQLEVSTEQDPADILADIRHTITA